MKRERIVASGTYTNALSDNEEEAPSVSGLCQPNLWQIALVVIAWAALYSTLGFDVVLRNSDPVKANSYPSNGHC